MVSAENMLLQVMRLKRKYSDTYIEDGEMPEPSAGFEARIIRLLILQMRISAGFRIQKSSCSCFSVQLPDCLYLQDHISFLLTGLNRRIPLRIRRLHMLKR